MLRAIVPSLLQANLLLDRFGLPRLATLDILLTRGRQQEPDCGSLEAWVCHELGIERQQDWPVAAVSLAAAGSSPGATYWLRADPVHLRLQRDKLILNEIDDLDEAEAQQLCAALASHFGESFSPQALRPNAWVIATAGTPDLHTSAFSQAAGRHIDPLLPRGADARYWHSLMNEAQMLLFQHPVNQAREERGQLPVNSIWIWGGGCLPATGSGQNKHLFTRHPDWQALARFTGSTDRGVPERWSRELPEESLLICDEAHRLLRQGHFDRWQETLRGFDANWLQPLLDAGQAFHIDDPVAGSSLYWRKTYRWKFWRRRTRPEQSDISTVAPAEECRMDPFGNRF